MQQVLAHIDVRNGELAARPVFEELRTGKSAAERLAAVPRLAFWVLSLQDVLRLASGRMHNEVLRECIRQHADGEAARVLAYFEDAEALKEHSLSTFLLYASTKACVRDASAALLEEARSATSDALLLTLALTLEAASNTLLQGLPRALGSQGGVQLRFLAACAEERRQTRLRFLEAAALHCQVMALSPQQRAEACVLADRAFGAFTLALDMLLRGRHGNVIPLRAKRQVRAGTR